MSFNSSPTQSWQQEMREAFREAGPLNQFLDFPEKIQENSTYPLFIPQTLAAKIKELGPSSALAKEFLPNSLELPSPVAASFVSSLASSFQKNSGLLDPIGDQKFMVAPGLIHRYPKSILFLPTTVCPVMCRYCFRKNELQISLNKNLEDENKSALELFVKKDFTAVMNYLEKHSEIEEIIFSGGDPLILSDEKLNSFLDIFSTLQHIKYIRFHSRTPVILPTRLDSSLGLLLQKNLKRFKKIIISIHINHIQEWSQSLEFALKSYQKLGITFLSQIVLLKGVNDSAQDLANLLTLLADHGIIPYYLHHPDQVRGGMHFYLPISEGRNIYHQLRKHVAHWMLPQYVWDVPGGVGKIPLFNPESFEFAGIVLNPSGQLQQAREP